MKSSFALAVSLAALAFAQDASAQDIAQAGQADDTQAEPADDPTLDPRTIVVTSTRVRGQLIVDQPPVAEYDAEDIAAFGGSSIADILAAIEPATGSARGDRGGGRPVFLINGIRVSGWREFRRYPPESVEKVEVFSEEVAQRFGFSPDQRVVNIILKNDFGSLTLEVEAEAPADGGFWRNEQEVGYLKIADGARLNFNLDVEDGSLLTEAERGLVVPSAIPGVADEAPFRSLVSDTQQIEGSANYARAFIDSGSSISLSGTVTRAEDRSLSGLRLVGGQIDPLETRRKTDSYAFGATHNRTIGDWQATFTNETVRALTDTEIDQRDGAGFDTADSQTWTIANKATFVGYPLELPAGELSATIDLGLDWRRITSEDSRALEQFSGTRRRFETGLNVNVPIAERGGHWGAIGGLSLNLSAGAEDLSDFGALTDWTAGLNWSPFDNLNIQATRIWREVAPSLTSLGSPRVETFNVPVFDFANGSDALVTVISGGNPNLAAETQADWKFGANWELPFWDNTRLQVDYAINRSDDVTLSSPSYTAAFESAFPERVRRDAAGDLLAIDRRPVTLFETRSRTLSFGLNTRGTVGGDSGGNRERGERRGERRGGGERRGPPQGADPEGFRQIREAFCAAPEGEMPDLSQLPEQFRARLLDDDGNPDPDRIAAARERFCAARPETRGENRRGPGGGGAGGMNPFTRDRGGQGRYFISLNHTIALENEILLASGGPLFDQIDGELIGGAPISQHATRLEGGLFWGGYGLRLTGRYEGEAVVRGAGLPGSSDLFYGDLATFDLRIWATLGEVLDRDEGWMKGLRVAFALDNVFDAKRNVVDEDGNTPDAFDPRRIDPVGRYIGIDLRKQF